MESPYRYCLLVEDDPDDQEFFIHALHSLSSRAGCHVVSSAEEALLLLDDEGFVPDIIFTDLRMPGIGGLGLLKRLKERGRLSRIPVVVYSSDCTDKIIFRAQLLGATAVYAKTHRYEALKGMLKKYFADVMDETVRAS